LDIKIAEEAEGEKLPEPEALEIEAGAEMGAEVEVLSAN
jgi:hypothetical protein